MTDKKLNTGGWNTGDLNAGNRNTGGCNTGDLNAGNLNAGNRNTGNWNTGDLNTGSFNTGNRNTGDWNTGDWNTGDWNTGYFNSDTPSKINVFDGECYRSDWDGCDKPTFIYFKLTEWVCESDMTEEEKEDFGSYKTNGGYLKKLDFKEAFKESYERADEEDRKKIFNLPNFDADKFLAISGIDVRVDVDKENKKKELIAKAEELLEQARKM